MSFNYRNLFVHSLVSVAMVPFLLWAVLSGGNALAATALLLTVLGAWEWVAMLGLGRTPGLAALAYAGPVLLLAAWWIQLDGIHAPLLFALTPIAIALSLTGPWQEEGAIQPVGTCIAGIMYVSLFGLMIPIGGDASGLGPVLLATLFFMIWIGDTLAYFGGSMFGRHRLAPSISPNKSWEGAAFGLAGSVAGALAGRWLFGIDSCSLAEMAALGAAIGVVGQVGDLGESMLKREAGVKDSSSILPGHGGIFDRFDSFLFSLPVLWLWMLIRTHLQGT